MERDPSWAPSRGVGRREAPGERSGADGVRGSAAAQEVTELGDQSDDGEGQSDVQQFHLFSLFASLMHRQFKGLYQCVKGNP